MNDDAAFTEPITYATFKFASHKGAWIGCHRIPSLTTFNTTMLIYSAKCSLHCLKKMPLDNENKNKILSRYKSKTVV